jgi:CheY-like chemotaxis protein
MIETKELFKPLKILIAESRDTDRMILEAIVKKMGHTHRSVTNGNDALKQYYEFLPQIILSEVNLPMLSGYELCGELIERNEKCLVIFLSESHDTESHIAGLNAGAVDFFSKPYHRIILEAKLKSLGSLLKRLSDNSYNNEFIKIRGSPINKIVELDVGEFKDVVAEIIKAFEPYCAIYNLDVECDIDTFKRNTIKFRIKTVNVDDAHAVEFNWKDYIDKVVFQNEFPDLPTHYATRDKYVLAASIQSRFSTILKEKELLEAKGVGFMEAYKKIQFERIIIQNNYGGTMNITGGNFDKCSFADRMENVIYEGDLGYSEEIFQAAKELVSKLSPDDVSNIKEEYCQHNDVSVIEKTFLKHGIPITQNLVASGIYSAIVAIIGSI